MMKKQKPIDFDCHLKYLCNQCGQEHWLSFKESSTKNFKVVCDCGNVFGVRQTLHIKIKYKPKTVASKPIKETQTNQIEEIPVDILNQSVKILVPYGFTAKEASDLIKQTYASSKISDISSLIKLSLASLRS